MYDLIPSFSTGYLSAYNNESPDTAHAIPGRRLVTYLSSISTDRPLRRTGKRSESSRRRADGGIVPIKALEVKSNNNNRAAPGVDLKTRGGTPIIHTRDANFTLVWFLVVRARALRELTVTLRAQRASVRSTRTPHRLRTRNRSSLLWCFPPWCPASTPAPSEGTHATPFVSLTTVGLSACLFSQSRAAADQMQICLPPLHPRALHCT